MRRLKKYLRYLSPIFIVKILARAFMFVRHRYNVGTEKIYTKERCALLGTLAVALIAIFLLFIPHINGLADDGSLADVMKAVGCKYTEADASLPQGSYFVGEYLHTKKMSGYLSTHVLLVRMAMMLDNMVTYDNEFDIRFLGLLYLIMYLPAVYLVIREVIERIPFASEATFITILGVAIFGDAAVVVSFNSLYPDALAMICILYILGIALSMQRRVAPLWVEFGYMVILSVSFILAFCESTYGIVAIPIALFCISQAISSYANSRIRTIALIVATMLVFIGISGLLVAGDRFGENSRLNAMTSGVLQTSKNPAEALAEFGIDSRFETLADTTCYDFYPYTTSGNKELIRDFYPYYNNLKVFMYYVKHPGDYLNLLELGTRNAFRSRRDYIGNYEYSAGFGERARTPWFSIFSNIKSDAIPGTTGFLIIIIGIYMVVLNVKSTKNMDIRRRNIALGTFILAIVCGATFCTAIIVRSGSAELSRYSLFFSICIDFAIYLFAAEIIHRLGFLAEK